MRSCFSYFLHVFTCVVIVVFVTNEIKEEKKKKKKKKGVMEGYGLTALACDQNLPWSKFFQRLEVTVTIMKMLCLFLKISAVFLWFLWAFVLFSQ